MVGQIKWWIPLVLLSCWFGVVRKTNHKVVTRPRCRSASLPFEFATAENGSVTDGPEPHSSRKVSKLQVRFNMHLLPTSRNTTTVTTPKTILPSDNKNLLQNHAQTNQTCAKMNRALQSTLEDCSYHVVKSEQREIHDDVGHCRLKPLCKTWS